MPCATVRHGSCNFPGYRCLLSRWVDTATRQALRHNETGVEFWLSKLEAKTGHFKCMWQVRGGSSGVLLVPRSYYGNRKASMRKQQL